MRENMLRAAGVVALALAAGCSAQPEQQRTPPPNARRVDQSKAGRISGRIVVEGNVPRNPTVTPDSDPVCARENKDGLALETFVAENGALNNVFVYIKNGLGDYFFETPTAAVKLDQQHCRYTPHVFGVQTGQSVEVSNSDPTVHSVAATAGANRAFNFSQPMQGMKNTISFQSPEIMVRFMCNVHTWMSAYAGVVAHPYFAVTEDGGRFEMKNVPAGTYTLEAWHEKLGTQSQAVTLGDNDSKQLTFTFKASTTLP